MAIQRLYKFSRLSGFAIMAKTILKLHADGSFETINTKLIQSNILGDYKFGENQITVPRIIEYPPQEKINYFINKTSVDGYIQHHARDGLYAGQFMQQSNEKERVSDYIDVNGWGIVTVRFRFYDTKDLQPWLSVQTYDNNKNYLDAPIRGNFGTTNSNYYMYEHKLNISTGFIRVSSSHWGYGESRVEISVEKGDTNDTKHYLALEDLPDWVRDTENPISIFKEGILIKGKIINSI